jgi:hypothetical protein
MVIFFEVVVLGVWFRAALYLLRMGSIDAINGSLMILWGVVYILYRIYKIGKNKDLVPVVQILEEETQ